LLGSTLDASKFEAARIDDGGEAMLRQLDVAREIGKSAELTFLLLRIAVSTILIWGALTKLAAGERLDQLAAAWAASGLPQAELLVSISIGAQLIFAVLLLVGLFTRTAGLLNGVNFACGAAVSGIFTAGSNWWPFALLVVLLLHFGVLGAGKLSIDGLRRRRGSALQPAGRSVEEVMLSIGIRPQARQSNHRGAESD
jgi:uncharacterized membrane protein YphA (DoxX/SURF4 family)